jgi:hypothetical protein
MKFVTVKAMRHMVWVAGLILLAVAGSARAEDGFDGLSDPTRPSSRSGGGDGPVSRGGLVLQSTLVSAERRFAVINGQKLAVGQHIDGAQIVAIGTYEVVLNRAGRESVLRLLPKSTVEKHRVEAQTDASKP